MNPSPTEWPTYQVDAANTGAHPAATGPNGPVEPRWQVEAELPWYAAPIVVDDTLYAGNNEGILCAIDLDTGVERWRFIAPEFVDHAVGIIDGRVFVGNRGVPRAVLQGEAVGGRLGASETLHKLDAETGAVLDSAVLEGGISSSPAVHEDSLVVCAVGESLDSPGGVFRIETDSLDVEWQFPLEYGVGTTPAIVSDTAYVGTDRNEVMALDVITGENRWRTQFEYDPVVEYYDGTYEDHEKIKGLAATESMIVASSTDGAVYGLDRSTGQKQWEFGLSNSPDSPPAIANDTVFVASTSSSGQLHAIDLETGAVQWTTSGPQSNGSPPTIVDGRVYVGDEYESTIAAFDADTGDRHWTATIDVGEDVSLPGVQRPLVVLDGRIYASIGNSVYALEDR